MRIRYVGSIFIGIIGLCLLLYFPVQAVYGASAGVATETQAGFVKKGTLPPTSLESSEPSEPSAPIDSKPSTNSPTKKGLLPSTGEMIILGMISLGLITLIVILVIYLTRKKLGRR